MVSATVFSTCTPALLTTTSTRPNASAAAAIRGVGLGRVGHVGADPAEPTGMAASRRLPVNTLAPASTKRSATARPIPELAPVTTTAAPRTESICGYQPSKPIISNPSTWSMMSSRPWAANPM